MRQGTIWDLLYPRKRIEKPIRLIEFFAGIGAQHKALSQLTQVESWRILRIRKLTPKECIRLMGFTDGDYDAMVGIGMTDSAIYHVAGDSIVVTVLMAIFGEMLGIDYRGKIGEYVESEVIGR